MTGEGGEVPAFAYTRVVFHPTYPSEATINIKKFVIAVLGVGVAVNVYDFVVNGMILQNAVYAGMPIFKQNMPLPWLIIGDFVAALVLVWVFDRVYGCFSGGVKGGAEFGFYAGVLINFPTWIFCYLLLNGFTYKLAWIMTVVGIIWAIIGGAVAGALYKK